MITWAKVIAYFVAAVAAINSFGHQVALLSAAELGTIFGFVPVAWVVPTTVDALAIVALMVRLHEGITERTKRAAMWPLILAGGLSIAANVAEAHNIVGIVVGVWTVLSYMLCEVFVARLRAAESPPRPVAPIYVPPPLPMATIDIKPVPTKKDGRPYSERHQRRLRNGR